LGRATFCRDVNCTVNAGGTVTAFFATNDAKNGAYPWQNGERPASSGVDEPDQAQYLGGPVGAGNPRSVLENAGRRTEPHRLVKIRRNLVELEFGRALAVGEHHPPNQINFG